MIVSEKKQRIEGSWSVAPILRKLLLASGHDVDKEHFWAIGVNTKHVMQYIDLVSLGILNQTIVHPREVFRVAVMRAARGIIVAHNHPSDDLTPSAEDEQVTASLVRAGEILQIKILDHIIIAAHTDEYLSFREAGYMDG